MAIEKGRDGRSPAPRGRATGLRPQPAAPSSQSSVPNAASVADILDRAADLIEPEGAWTQNAYARDAGRKPLGDGRNEAAVCWCAVGALEKAGGDLVGEDLVTPVRAVLPNTKLTLVEWNDAPHRTQAEVVAKLREAASKARQQVSS